MPDQETKRDSSARIQIIVALIGLLGVIAAALISNWSSIFPKTPAPTPIVTGSGTGSPKKVDHPSPGSERQVHSEGRLVIRGTYSCDLDTGTEREKGADFFWEQQAATIRFLTPENGAGFYVVGPTSFESVRWSDMERFPYSAARIPANADNSNRIPAGTVVAYKTNEGRLGKFIVDEYGYNLAIRWRTYD